MNRFYHRFFASLESSRVLALVRIGLCSVVACEAAARWPYAIELYSSAGRPMPLFDAPLVPPIPGPAATVVLHTLLMFCAASACVGWNTRVSLVAAAALLAWLGPLDLPGTFKKYSVIELHLLMLLACGQPGAVWSLDARRRGSTPLVPAWPRRLMRLHLCAVYLGAAITKLRSSEFLTGELLEFALLDDLWGGRALGRWLAGHPRLLVAGAWATVALELLFPLLVWFNRPRRPMLLAAVAFHLLLHMTLHLGTFSLVMLCGLAAFLEDDDLRPIAAWLARPRLRRAAGVGPSESPTSRSTDGSRVGTDPTSSVPSAVERADQVADSSSPPERRTARNVVGFALAAAAFALVGLSIQRSIDWYGVFSSRHFVEYPPIPADEFDAMRAAQQPAAASYVRRLALGTGVANGTLKGESARFPRGTTVHGLARFVRRAEPLSIAWLLIAPDGSEVARLAKPLPPEATHATAGFEMPADAPTGRYRVVMQIDGYDAAEAAFALEP